MLRGRLLWPWLMTMLRVLRRRCRRILSAMRIRLIVRCILVALLRLVLWRRLLLIWLLIWLPILRCSLRVPPLLRLRAASCMLLLRLRTDIFVVEQACPYPELDGRDEHSGTVHLWTYGPDRVMAACLRILAPGVAYGGVSLGRVAVHRAFRAVSKVALPWNPGRSIRY